MLSMGEVAVVRHKVLVEGRSVRSVARELGFSRNTVRKYLGQPEPRRHEAGPRRRPVRDVVAPRIEALIEEWSSRTGGKQRVTGTRVLRELRAEGVEVGHTLVRAILAERRRAAAEVFVPLVHRPGDEAQVDFFDVLVDVAGERRRAWLFLLRLMHGGRDFVWLYERQDQVSFLDGHVRAFEALGGVPRRVVYDNLKAAVRRVLRRGRDLAERFQALSSHYAFEPCFARPGEGHDKGGVEGRGGHLRTLHLVPIPRGESLEEISRALQARVDADVPEEAAGRRAADAAALRPLPSVPFEARRVVPVTVSSRALVQVEGAAYSVPSRWARREATAYLGVASVRLVLDGEAVVHPRQRFGGRRVCYRHYLPELARKPQAVRQVAPELVAELGEPYGRLWSLLATTHGELEGARVLARVLGAVVDHGESAVARAAETALDAGVPDLRALVALRPAEPPPPRVHVPERLAAFTVEAARARDYDALLLAAGEVAGE
jgi:transposase